MGAAVIWFENVQRHDIARVGGKNASLGEMIAALSSSGIEVPNGFATTAVAYWRFIDANGLRAPIGALLRKWESGKTSLAETGAAIRKIILGGRWPTDVEEEIITAYRSLSRMLDVGEASVAVRSSATAEDLPTASFAGQQESFLNVVGEGALMDACRRCYASLFTDRAISYRKANAFDHMKVALSVGVQQMVRSDLGGAGVMFSIETETGFDKVVLINAAWGLGEYVVKGVVDPDEYRAFKPLLADSACAPIIQKRLGTKTSKLIYGDSGAPTRGVPTSAEEQASLVLSDAEILTLARWAVALEEHYGCPMDIEWAKDGDCRIYIVQARPETVQARAAPGLLPTYRIGKKGRLLAKGLAIGNGIAAGPVCLIDRPEDIGKFVDGAILVTTTTDPDWVSVMKRASAIVTDHGGRTSHAAIVSRELGVPAIVGAENATEALRSGDVVTVSCAEGDEGFIYEGRSEFKAETISLADIPETRTKVMLNLADPQSASRWWRFPADGIGLARMEFVITNAIQIHPMALVHFDRLKDRTAQERIAALTAGYPEKTDYFVDQLSQGLARLAAVAYPNPVIVRMSDFKTNEYAGLCGGAEFEPQEENPMIGFRGASRYYSPKYRDGFALECRAIKLLRETMGFRNVVVMIPFCRSVTEAEKVLAVMAENGLKRGVDGLEVYVMCEIPSNVVLATAFARAFDGFSIGSNDLTQLTLGVDRDSEDLAASFNEEDEAVKWMIAKVITDARQAGTKIGLCGQAPSDHPNFAAFLVECGINSVSVTPDSFVAVKKAVAAAEKAR
ncbi:Phosphoenolpyruvate synthase (plasmid) [Sinorhizobium sojae CCBAU 05684]|uniref:Phosphoenolpyruvate synthase n=1 Tax=Sinorhizobium sojae CCBAU 05684 TaxID=716928 RepID=A0A249PJB8_9HYPH|nr:phosphoenolpyruvate synthase [Sinorhizobium sojae]ASY65794.1 Phosphoenolpyruvate synthase [Sinorhizobium sojae CCBAU 05684]